MACKTKGGVITTALSDIQNSSWQILVGDPGNMEYGVHLSAADISSWNGVFADEQSNLYSGSKLRHAIMFMDRKTGLVSKWLGDMTTAGCPTATVANFTLPRIIDITNGEMTVVSGPCHTITRIKISDKSIVWNRTVAELNGDDSLAISNPTYDVYLKSGYYYFSSYHSGLIRTKAYYEIDLNTLSSTPKIVVGNGTDCSSFSPTVGVAGDAMALPCAGGDLNGWISVMPDRSKAYIYYRTNSSSTANRFEMTYNNVNGKWEVSAAQSAATNICSRAMYVGTDSSKYFCMYNIRSGNQVAFVDTTTGNYGGSNVTLATDEITEVQASLGSSANSVYILTRDTNELFEVKHSTTGGWSSNKIGGTSFLKYGNGTNPAHVAFTSIAGIAYDYTNNYLYTRGVRHLRRMVVDTTTTPGTPFISRIDTAFPDFIKTLLNTYGSLQVSNDGSKMLMNSGSTGGYRWDGVALSTSIWPIGSNAVINNTTNRVEAHTGLSSNTPTLGTTFNVNQYLIWDWGSSATFMADGNFYFTGSQDQNQATDLAVYRRDMSITTNSIVAIVGKTGASGSTTFTNGATALGIGLSKVIGMQEDADGELMVYDNTRLLQITAKTSPGSPKAYLVHDFTTFTNFPAGKTWIEAVYDPVKKWHYLLANNGTTTDIYAAHDTGKTFIQISTTGLNLPGIKPGNRGKAFYMKVTPLGLLLQDAYKRRILYTPLKN